MAEVGAPRIFISLGSNIDKERNVATAVQLLAAAVPVVAVSSVYETAPLGDPHQANFLNAVVVVETDLPREEVKREVLAPIEDRLGRVRTANKNAPRTIDLDVVLVLDAAVPAGGTVWADPEALTHAHVVLPLAEVLPGFVPPGSGETLAEIARRLAPPGEIVPRPDLDLRRYLR